VAEQTKNNMFSALTSDSFDPVSVELENDLYIRFLSEKGVETTSVTVKGTPWKIVSDSDAESYCQTIRSTRIFAVRDSRDLMLFTGSIQHPLIELDDGGIVERDGETTLAVSGGADGEMEVEVTKQEADALFNHRVQLPYPLLTAQEGATYVSYSTFLMPTWFTNLLGGYMQNVFRLHCLVNKRRVATEGMEMRPLVFNSCRLNCKAFGGGHKLSMFLHPHSGTCICGKRPTDDPCLGRSYVVVNLSFCGAVCNQEFCASGCSINSAEDVVIDPALPLICHSGIECEIVCDHGDGTPYRQRYHKVLPVNDRRAPKCFATVAKAIAAEEGDDDDDDVMARHEHMQTVLSAAAEVDVATLCEETTPEELAERDQVCLDVLASPQKYTVVPGKNGYRFKKRDDQVGRKQRQNESAMLLSHGHLCR
jgi:hypothetical protein